LDTFEGRIVNSEIVMEQKWGGVIDRPDVDVIEIRWFDTTFDLRTQDFKQFLEHPACFTGPRARGHSPY
jgi:hypothetical protein